MRERIIPVPQSGIPLSLEGENNIEKDERQNIIEDQLISFLFPWALLPERDLNNLMQNGDVNLLVIALARKCGLSPEFVLDNLPKTIELNGHKFVVRIKRTDRIPIKKMIRESVDEPPILGIRNGGKSLDTKKLERKIKLAERERKKILFRLFNPEMEEEKRNNKLERIREKREEKAGKKWGAKNESSQKSFTPEKIELSEGKLFNSETVSFKAFFDEVMDLTSEENIFPFIENTGNKHNDVERLLSMFSKKTPEDALVNRILSMASNESKVSLGAMCLPCLNPSPYITDHPSFSVNAPTVIFLQRLNHLAEQLQSILGVPVQFNLARELEHMKRIFDMDEESINTGIQEINDLIDERQLNHINICEFPISETLDKSASPYEIERFFPAFKRSQVADLDSVTIMLWIGVIDFDRARKTARKKGIDLSHELAQTQELEDIARKQAETWARLRESPWQKTEDMKGSIIISIRPGSNKFTLIPISDKSSDQFPMLPQHCSVGINKDGNLVTMKRVDFLLNPAKWVEVITEHGAVFINSLLI